LKHFPTTHFSTVRALSTDEKTSPKESKPQTMFTVVSVLASILCGAFFTRTTNAVDCALVRCAAPPDQCAPGETLSIPDGGCCEFCVQDGAVLPDCSAVTCLVPTCASGETQVTPFGECCPLCESEATDCSAVLCLVPSCDADEILRTPNGECCQQCIQKGSRRVRRRDCSLVLCAQVACEENEVAFVPRGQCCGRCRPAPPSTTEAPCACTDCEGNCQNSVFNCFADPCSIAGACAEGESCKSNYCGGCNACCGPA